MRPRIIAGTPIIKIKKIMAKLKRKHSKRVSTVEHLVIKITAISLRTNRKGNSPIHQH